MKISQYPGGNAYDSRDHTVAIPFRIHVGDQLLSLYSMTTVFGTPLDVALAELAIEFFIPADAATVEAVTATVV